MTAFVHLVAHTLPGLSPFKDTILAEWFWRRLRRAFPDALAACLMPNHVHTITPGDPRRNRLRLAALASGFTRHLPGERGWIEIAPADVLSDPKKLERTIRYVHLNPCRAKLTKDPLEWPYSTHRGAIGAELDAWISPSRLSSVLGWPRRDFTARFHSYVSGDPSVSITGTPPPAAIPREPVRSPSIPLDTILAAAIAATPWSRRSERRRTAALLAHHQGWRDARLVGSVTGMCPQWIRKLWARPAPELLEPALLCLGDARLRAHVKPRIR